MTGLCGIVIRTDVLQIKSLGAWQIVVQLHSPQLPFSAQAIRDHEICLGSVERRFAFFRFRFNFQFFTDTN